MVATLSFELDHTPPVKPLYNAKVPPAKTVVAFPAAVISCMGPVTKLALFPVKAIAVKVPLNPEGPLSVKVVILVFVPPAIP